MNDLNKINDLNDVIVIGAGVSGLSAAKLLIDHGINKILVLEAKNRVGGRTYTVKNDQVNYVDLGGAYVGVTQSHLHRMLRELKINTYKIDESTDVIFYNYDRNVKRNLRLSDALNIGNFIENLDINNFLRKLDEIGKLIDVKEPWNSVNAQELDRKTYAQFVDENCMTKLGKQFAKNFINLNVTCEPYEASLLWFAWYVRQCGGVKRIVSTTGGGQDSKTVGGMMQISEKLSQIIGKNKIKLEDPVSKIEYDCLLSKDSSSKKNELEKYCKVTTSSGKVYFSKKVVMAMAPCMQAKIQYEPPLPSLRNQLVQRQPMGTVMKSIIYYKTRFWRDMGCCGSMMLLGENAEETPMFYTLDDTKPDNSKPALIGFILADKLRSLINKTKEERRDLIAKSLAKALNNELALYPCHYEEHTMMEEQYTGGCYTAFSPPGFITNYGHLMRQSLNEVIFFAGTETSISWSGYINGAIESGERAAREVLVQFKKLKSDEIWVEEPYLDDYPKFEFSDTFYEKYAPSVKGLIKFSTHSLILAGIIGFLFVHKGKSCLKFPFEMLSKIK